MKTKLDTELRTRMTNGKKRLFVDAVGKGNASKVLRKFIDETIMKYMETANEPNKN
jgi:hypothetical protein